MSADVPETEAELIKTLIAKDVRYAQQLDTKIERDCARLRIRSMSELDTAIKLKRLLLNQSTEKHEHGGQINVIMPTWGAKPDGG